MTTDREFPVKYLEYIENEYYFTKLICNENVC